LRGHLDGPMGIAFDLAVLRMKGTAMFAAENPYVL
jgi:hypothetical protein